MTDPLERGKRKQQEDRYVRDYEDRMRAYKAATDSAIKVGPHVVWIGSRA